MSLPKVCFSSDDFFAIYHDFDEEELWKNNLEKVELFFKNNKIRPNSSSKNKEEKYLGNWILTQNKNYKNKTQIMNDFHIRKIWEDFIKEYKEYFLTFEEK